VSTKSLISNRLFNYLLKFQPFTHYQSDSRRWEREYGQGKWEYLRDANQLPHYSVIVGYARYYAPGGALLDIGCGEGLLQEQLRTTGYSEYRGIDFSANAIRTARPREDDRTTFRQANAASYQPDRKFDAIILNESLYYFREPLSSLAKYDQWLTSEGVYIISMWQSLGTCWLWRKLRKRYRILHSVKLSRPAGVSHRVKVLRPRDLPR